MQTARTFHDRKDWLRRKRRAAIASRPTCECHLLLLACAFACRLCLLHLFRHLGFHCVKIEARAPLHGRVFEEGLEFLAHHLLDEDKAPELELKPIEVLLRPPLWSRLAASPVRSKGSRRKLIR